VGTHRAFDCAKTPEEEVMTQTTRDTTTATGLLRQQHETVKSMFEELDRASGDARRELFDCLRATLAVHETAEEMIVHPAARRTGAEGERIVEARLAEEDKAKQDLAELEKITPDGDGFGVKLLAFKQAVIDHAEAEEHQLFPLLEKSCSTEELERMATGIQTAEKMAPTHPHPHGPNSAVGNLLVGPFVSMVDRVRDHLKK
jgi:hemerythrin superfamily protein